MQSLSEMAKKAEAFSKPPGVSENWSAEKRGRALFFVFTLANNPHTGWKSKAQIWSALQEFRV